MIAKSWSVSEAERYLDSLEVFGMRFGLDRMHRLMTALGSPVERFEAVQVVGTNGKSSTARMIAAVLHRHDVRVGVYLSPHLGSFAERIEIEERPLAPVRFAAAVEKAAEAAGVVDRVLPQGECVTQFEALTAAAFVALAGAEVEAAVIEAGLGARYDATSVARADVLAVTNVALEHTRWLGPTKRHVAEEKLAVAPPGGTVVAGPLGREALAVARRVSAERGARLLLAGGDFAVEDERGERFTVRTPRARIERVRLRATGRFQRSNFALAVAAAGEYLARRGRSLDVEAVRDAAQSVLIPGRLEVVSHRPLLVLDGAHNAPATRALRASLPEVVGERPVVGLLSILDDKDAAAMLSELLPVFREVVFTRSSHPRALPPATLESLTRQLSGPPVEVVTEPVAALERAQLLAGEDGAVLVCGSIHLLSDLVRAAAAGLRVGQEAAT